MLQTCVKCIRTRFLEVEPWVRLILNSAVFGVSTFLYTKCGLTLNRTSVDRKSLLTLGTVSKLSRIAKKTTTQLKKKLFRET